MNQYKAGAPVHTNAGILNHAFYLAVTKFPDEQPCNTIGQIWWDALKDTEKSSKVESFQQWAELVVSKAGEKTAKVKEAFAAVGLNVK